MTISYFFNPDSLIILIQHIVLTDVIIEVYALALRNFNGQAFVIVTKEFSSFYDINTCREK